MIPKVKHWQSFRSFTDKYFTGSIAFILYGIRGELIQVVWKV